jgi:hypothetical protein
MKIIKMDIKNKVKTIFSKKDEDIAVQALKNYKKSGYKFSNVKNEGGMVSVQIDYKFKGSKKDNNWVIKNGITKDDIVQIIGKKAVKEMEIFKNPNDVIIIDNGSIIRRGIIKYTSYWVDKGASISIIVKTNKDNINIENDMKIIKMDIKNKVKTIFSKKDEDTIKESLKIIMGKENYPKDLTVSDVTLDNGKKAFRIDSDKTNLSNLDYKKLEFYSTYNKDPYDSLLSIELLKKLKRKYKIENINRIRNKVDVWNAGEAGAKKRYYFTVFIPR